MKKSSRKKTKKIFQIVMLVLAIICLVFVLLAIHGLINQANQTDDNTVPNKANLYEAPNNMTDYQKQLYDELTDSCSKVKDINTEDLSELAPVVAKNFIADYFSWGNKRGSYDVGGIDYVYGPYHMNFSFGARDYYYYQLDLLMKEYGVENLPIVDDIVIDAVEKQDSKYEVSIWVHDYSNDTDHEEPQYYDAYLVKAHWTYSVPNDSKFNINELPNKSNIMLIVSNGRLEVAYMHEDYVRDIAND